MSVPDSQLPPDSRRVAEATRRALVEAALEAYEEAGLSGLCAEGRWEVAIGAIRDFDIGPVIDASGESAK
ncbi:MAG: acetyltransferase [Gemmatimonadaceae bacterium]